MNDTSALDQIYRFGGGATDTTITSATVLLLVTAILLFFLLPKKYLVAPLLCVSILVPLGQVVVIAGMHFSVFRLVLPFAWVRLLAGRSDNEKFRFCGIDKVIVLWALSSALFFTLLWGSFGAFVNRLGFLYNVFGIYFLLRLMIRNREDVNRTIRVLAVVCCVIGVFMVLEQQTGRNVFSMFGGVPEITSIREGRLRSQAVFAHAIVAGTVGATLVPVFIGLWWQGCKMIAAAGVIGGLVMVLTSASSTPLFALVFGVLALSLWPIRTRMRPLRWAVVICLVTLHLAMKAPVWALIQRVDLVGGSSGWHRYALIDETIRHFGDWWFTGERNPSRWGWYVGDVSNAYMDAAVSGGLVTLILFFGILKQSFRAIGIARRALVADRKLELQVWAFGAALSATCAAYIGITFFDQSILIWYVLLAMICSITSAAAVPTPQPENAPAPAQSWMEAAGLPDRVW